MRPFIISLIKMKDKNLYQYPQTDVINIESGSVFAQSYTINAPQSESDNQIEDAIWDL